MLKIRYSYTAGEWEMPFFCRILHQLDFFFFFFLSFFDRSENWCHRPLPRTARYYCIIIGWKNGKKWGKKIQKTTRATVAALSGTDKNFHKTCSALLDAVSKNTEIFQKILTFFYYYWLLPITQQNYIILNCLQYIILVLNVIITCFYAWQVW